MTLDEYRDAIARLPFGAGGPIGGPLVYSIEVQARPSRRIVAQAPMKPRPTVRRAPDPLEVDRQRSAAADAAVRWRLLNPGRLRRSVSPAGWMPARMS
jgi:hypothetical protein